MICPIPIQQLEHLSDPRSVTVIGASNKPSKWGANVFSRVLFSPRARGVCPTNNGTQRVLGIGAYPTVRNIPGPVEPALVEMLLEGVPLRARLQYFLN